MHLMISNLDGRILNVGQPPWGNADQLSDYTILDIGSAETPSGDLRDYRYVNDEFIFDPLPPPAATVRREETQTRFQQLTAGLGGLSVEDRSYAITARVMAYKDGATNGVILGISSKASAQAYVTSKPEWGTVPNTVRPMLIDMLETMAGMAQVIMLILE